MGTMTVGACAVPRPESMKERLEVRRDAALKAAKEYQDIIDLLVANPSAESVLKMLSHSGGHGMFDL